MTISPTSVIYRITPARQAGMGFLDVLLAIVIFVVGMLALAQLQTNLTRSSSDANSRTVAANIAEETIEDMRNFEVIASQTGKKAYNDIVDGSTTVSRGGIDYTVAVDVQDYFFGADRVSVQKTAPTGVSGSSFKHVEVTVSWNTAQEFQIDETQSTSGRLGSGSISTSAIIPSISSFGNLRVASVKDETEPATPQVNYTPGLNPDIVAIELGANKFKESTTPEPVVRRRNELVETWFDVITYSTSIDGSIFLRREEFASISCECTLRAASGNGDDGRQPTLWTGAEWAEGELAGKQYGESASNQQSQYCDVCCRDHHDTASGPTSYRPWASSFSGDHPHYNRSRQGVLSVASVGQTYIEACRLVRKDGFFRVAQDFDLKGQNAFPENYLDDGSEVSAYSDYVVDSINDYFDNGTPMPSAASTLNFDGRDYLNPTNLPTANSATSQQLRSRGIYIDTPSTALQANLYNCFDDSGDRDQCQAPLAQSPIELYPFFDVQLTKLARWTETAPDDPVDITNEEISNQGYSRGVGKLAGSMLGQSRSHSTIETGNSGLISIAPIALTPAPAYSTVDLTIEAGGDSTPPTDSGQIVVSGSLTNAGGTGTAIASVSGTGASCTRPTNTTFVCVIDPTAGIHSLTVSNYYKAGADLIACTADLLTLSSTQGASLSANSTTFELPASDLTGVVIVIDRSPCG